MLGDINLTLKPQNQTKQILQHRYKKQYENTTYGSKS